MADEFRAEAVQQLVRVASDGAYAARLPGSDEARGLTASVLRWRRYLDFLLASAYRSRLAKLEPRLRAILQVGVYELVLGGTPAHAAVNESVDLAKSLVRPGAGRLVNGVLRTIERSMDQLPEPEGALEERLAIRWSHPTWMVRRWLQQFGEASTRMLLAFNNRVPVYTVRAHPVRLEVSALAERLEALGVRPMPSRWHSEYLQVQRTGPVVRSELLTEGKAAIQDVAAGLVVNVLSPVAGERVLDMCAAPGGKATRIAHVQGDGGDIVAVDLNSRRVRLVRRAAQQQGLNSIDVRAGDVTELAAGFDPFDAVLLDAPCSGTGVLSKRADLRWNRHESDLAELIALQDRLLDTAARAVKPGGRIVYSTCSLERDENEERVDAFVSRHPEFEVRDVAGRVPEPMRTAAGDYAAQPHLHNTDGAFAALIVRAQTG
ncbi:MAG: 16S rRNA (cytosine(967)-C(5))-methyltransferase RsmB [Bacteroidota bacterium]